MRSYDVTAEFYDILHAPDYLTLAERVLGSWLGAPRLAVLDVGAGTGLGTVALAARCRVPIHAVEPAAGMRAVLLSRLAGRHELLDRVTVHAAGMEQLGLTRMADFALCLNVLGTMDADHREGDRVDGDRLRWRFTYRVTRGDAIVREATEAFDGFLVPAARFAEELSRAGFTPEQARPPRPHHRVPPRSA